ncbi:hypothetical protein Tco_0380244, partial [Tanacetum coccineum]
MDACDQVHSEGMSLRTTVMAQQSEIVELRAADQRRQTVISELLKADYRRQKTRGSLKTLLEITKPNNQTKGRTQAGLMLPGMVTGNRMRGLNLDVP